MFGNISFTKYAQACLFTLLMCTHPPLFSFFDVDIPSEYKVELDIGPNAQLLLDNMPMNVRQQLEVFMVSLFENQLTPMLYELDAIAANRIEETAGLADSIVENRLRQVNGIINDVILRFSAATSQTIRQVKSDLLVEAGNQIQGIRKDFMGDMAKLINCTIWSKYGQVMVDAERLKNNLIDRVSFWRTLPNCYKKNGMTKRNIHSIRYASVYAIKKCEVLEELTDKSPRHVIRGAYVDLAEWAQKMSCVNGNGNIGKDFYYKEILSFEKNYRMWDSLGAN